MKKNYKVPLALILLALFILLSGWGNYLLLNRDARNLLEATEIIQSSIEKGNWAEALKGLNDTNRIWKKISSYWPMLVHHEEMDRIEESMNKLKSYLRHENKTEAMAEMYNLIYFIKHIPQKEAFNLQNVF